MVVSCTTVAPGTAVVRGPVVPNPRARPVAPVAPVATRPHAPDDFVGRSDAITTQLQQIHRNLNRLEHRLRGTGQRVEEHSF